jgi:RNA polymerase sigma-70 factor (ECF subfamily)
MAVLELTLTDPFMNGTTSQTATSRNADDFERFRSYLYLLARSHIDSRHRARLDPSDVVQQTLLNAHQKQGQFRGSTDGELLAWLKQILANNLADAIRGLVRAKRNIARERSLDEQIGDSFSRADGWLAAVQASPIQQVVLAEELLHMADALRRLPEAQREAIVLHHLQGLPLAEVGAQLGISSAAVAGLLHRGLKGLRELMAPGDRDNSVSTHGVLP